MPDSSEFSLSDDTVVDAESSLKLPDVFWMTRSESGGVLSNRVELWVTKPDRYRYPDGDVEWLPPEGSDFYDSFHDEWTIEAAKLQYTGAPDNSRECLKVGGPQ